MIDREKKAFFESVQRQERESRERYENNPELKKRAMLKSMSNGFGRNQKNKPKNISLPKMSWDK